MLRTEYSRFAGLKAPRFIAGFLACVALGTAHSSAFATAGEKPKPASKATSSSTIAWKQLEEPMAKLRTLGELYASDSRVVGAQDLDNLEALANEAVIARLIKSVYVSAAEKKWVQTQGYRIFPVEKLLNQLGESNSCRI